MKTFAIAAVVALGASTQVASAANCLDDIPGLTAALTPIITPAVTCQTLTGYAIVPPSALPTADQLAAICSKCTDLIQGAKAVTFPSCTLPIDGKDIPLSELFNSITGKCGAPTTAPTNAPTSGPTSGPTTGPTTAPTSGPNPTTATPAPTTVKPQC